MNPILKERFEALMMARFDNRIHQLIKHLATFSQPENEGLGEQLVDMPNGGLNDHPQGNVNHREHPVEVQQEVGQRRVAPPPPPVQPLPDHQEVLMNEIRRPQNKRPKEESSYHPPQGVAHL